jgi:hypothetical protein
MNMDHQWLNTGLSVVILLAISFQIAMKAMIYRRLCVLIHEVHDAIRVVNGYGVAAESQKAITNTVVNKLAGEVSHLTEKIVGSDSVPLSKTQLELAQDTNKTVHDIHREVK